MDRNRLFWANLLLYLVCAVVVVMAVCSDVVSVVVLTVTLLRSLLVVLLSKVLQDSNLFKWRSDFKHFFLREDNNVSTMSLLKIVNDLDNDSRRCIGKRNVTNWKVDDFEVFFIRFD